MTIAHHTIYSRRGTSLHDYLCDAMLEWGGFITIDDELYTVLGAVNMPEVDAFRWSVVPGRYAGAA